MSTYIQIRNCQRRLRVNSTWLKKTAEHLWQAVLANLCQSPAKHVPSDLVSAMAKRAVLSLVLVSNYQIRKINRRWRNKDSATDVLAFPLCLNAPPVGLPWELGEVVISVETASEQARLLGHSLERELSFLFVHGALHVLGFDHENKEDEIEMLSRQKEILQAASLPS